jgi:3-oxoacyl-[acyl-carrier-protein] synthase III
MIFLHSVSVFHPENVIDNSFLASLDIGASEQWTLDRVGIRERRTVLPLDYIRTTKNADPREAVRAAIYSNADTSERAATSALQAARISASDVGLVIAGSSSCERTAPAQACEIAARLMISAPCFDLNAACSSFAVQLDFLRRMDPKSLPDYILLVNPENSTRLVDYSDRSNAVLVGDGTTAAVLSPRVHSEAEILFSRMYCDPQGWDRVTVASGGYFHQQGAVVQKFAVTRTVELVRELSDLIDDQPCRVLFVGHQANLTALETICGRARINSANHFYNVDRFGNTFAAGAPSVLAQNWKKFLPGDAIIVAVVGSGLTWAGFVVRFRN